MPISTPRSGDPVPRHGDRGDVRTPLRFPRTLTVAVSRQAGARGGAIAKRAGRKLGWQVIDQELLEYVAGQGSPAEGVPEAAREWCEARLDELRQGGQVGNDADSLALARSVLAMGAIGEVIIVGRGAGYILPRGNTLHVRVVAPRGDRIAYLGQLMRLAPDEAERELAARDERRARFLLDQFSADPADPTHYDLLLNSGRLGEELCAELLVQAARGKLLGADPAGPPENGGGA